ncbi:MAG: hypothetical protein M0T78_10830 [Actinomycetota bacterium]|nr:hypothetical protein [Actinomycetota bacterium]
MIRNRKDTNAVVVGACGSPYQLALTFGSNYDETKSAGPQPSDASTAQFALPFIRYKRHQLKGIEHFQLVDLKFFELISVDFFIGARNYRGDTGG